MFFCFIVYDGLSANWPFSFLFFSLIGLYDIVLKMVLSLCSGVEHNIWLIIISLILVVNPLNRCILNDSFYCQRFFRICDRFNDCQFLLLLLLVFTNYCLLLLLCVFFLLFSLRLDIISVDFGKIYMEMIDRQYIIFVRFRLNHNCFTFFNFFLLSHLYCLLLDSLNLMALGSRNGFAVGVHTFQQ